MEEEVSVLMVVYNHEKWLEKAILSIINQVTEYKFCLYIHDDCSTDQSRNIIENYARKYPEIIVPVFAKKNRLSRGISPFVQILLPMAKGKFVMCCEGDDYWVDNKKIQKQIDYLKNNLECRFCFGNAMRIDTEGNYLKTFFPEKRWRDKSINKKMALKKDAFFSMEEMILLDFIPTAGICGYKEDMLMASSFTYCLDITIRLVCASQGNYIYYFNDIFSAYRTGNNMSASGSIRHSKDKMMEDFYSKHRKILEEFDEFTRKKYHEVIYHEIERKYLLVYLNTDFRNSLKQKRFCELPIEKIIKEVGRNYFSKLFVILKRLKYKHSKISNYI